VAISTGLPLSGVPAILIADVLVLLAIDNSSTACTLVYRHPPTKLGSQPKILALRLGDAEILASPVAPDTEAWMQMQMIGAHLGLGSAAFFHVKLS
jgi:hypothetical protein